MDIKKLLINVGLLGLVVFGLMAFIITNQSSSGVDNPLIDNDLIGNTYRDLNETLIDTSQKAETSSDDFGKETPTKTFGELEVTSIFSAGKVARTIIMGLWNVYIVLPQAVLGVSPVVASLISSLILILIIIGIWAIIKGAISS